MNLTKTSKNRIEDRKGLEKAIRELEERLARNDVRFFDWD